MFSDVVYKWLDNALDYGITEYDFWNMTIVEIERAINSKRRVKKIEAKEKASFDYILADLIGKSVSRIYNSSNKIPEINEVYPSLFASQEVEEQRAAKRDELSALRFRQFANAHNKKYMGGDKAE